MERKQRDLFRQADTARGTAQVRQPQGSSRIDCHHILGYRTAQTAIAKATEWHADRYCLASVIFSGGSIGSDSCAITSEYRVALVKTTRCEPTIKCCLSCHRPHGQWLCMTFGTHA